MKKLVGIACLSVILGLMMMPATEAQIVEEESFYKFCFYQCNYVNGERQCHQPDPDRCCWMCIEYWDSCSESTLDGCGPECGGTGTPGL